MSFVTRKKLAHTWESICDTDAETGTHYSLGGCTLWLSTSNCKRRNTWEGIFDTSTKTSCALWLSRSDDTQFSQQTFQDPWLYKHPTANSTRPSVSSYCPCSDETEVLSKHVQKGSATGSTLSHLARLGIGLKLHSKFTFQMTTVHKKRTKMGIQSWQQSAIRSIFRDAPTFLKGFHHPECVPPGSKL